jgi:hypothetical protein
MGSDRWCGQPLVVTAGAIRAESGIPGEKLAGGRFIFGYLAVLVAGANQSIGTLASG